MRGLYIRVHDNHILVEGSSMLGYWHITQKETWDQVFDSQLSWNWPDRVYVSVKVKVGSPRFRQARELWEKWKRKYQPDFYWREM